MAYCAKDTAQEVFDFLGLDTADPELQVWVIFLNVFCQFCQHYHGIAVPIHAIFLQMCTLWVQAMFGGGGVDGFGDYAAGVPNC